MLRPHVRLPSGSPPAVADAARPLVSQDSAENTASELVYDEFEEFIFRVFRAWVGMLFDVFLKFYKKSRF